MAVPPSSHAALVLDAGGEIRAISGAAEALLGASAAELIGAHVDQALTHVSFGQGSVFATLTACAGDVVPVQTNGEPLTAECTALIGVGEPQWLCRLAPKVSSVSDAELLQQVVEHSPIAKIVADEAGTIRYANPQAESLFGYPQAELIGQSVDMLVPHHTKDRHPELRRHYRARARPRALSGLKALRRDGSLVPVNLGLTPIEIDGRPHVVASAIDESGRERAEASLRAVIEHTPAEVFQLDAQGRVMLINERARRLFGYESEEAIGQPLKAFVCFPESAPDGPSCDLGVIHDGARANSGVAECVGVRRDGHRFPIHLVLEPVDTPNGQVVLAAITDLTPIIESDRMLERARSMAEEAADVKTGFLATISHEMRTPLNSVIGLSELLEDTPLTQAQSEYVESIRMGGTMLLNLIQDVLDLAKFESGTLQLQEMVFDPKECLHEALEVVRGGADAKGLSLNSQVAESVPVHVSGDPHRLRQVLVNLLGNAIKFTEAGGVSVRVSQHAGPEGRVALAFKVSDTGIGIPEDRLDKLFQAFSQADAEIQRRFGGSGLGLVISKRLVEAMDGSISVESTLGRGSTFEFHVQLRPAPAIEHERRATLRQRPKPSLRPLKVLLVEDNVINQRVAQMMLARLNQKSVVTAENGRQAVEAVRREDFDVILMDLLMPEMDGLEASRHIRQTLAPDRQPHIIAMTANAMPGDRERCLEAGMDDYLSKPVRMYDLLTVLSRYVGGGFEPAMNSA